MITGTITFSGINDKDLIKLLEIKVRHEYSLTFNPQALQPATPRQPSQAAQTLSSQQLPRAQTQPSQPHPLQSQAQQYNNATFAWQDVDGLEAVQEILLAFLKKEERHQGKVRVPRQGK